MAMIIDLDLFGLLPIKFNMKHFHTENFLFWERRVESHLRNLGYKILEWITIPDDDVMMIRGCKAELEGQRYLLSYS